MFCSDDLITVCSQNGDLIEVYSAKTFELISQFDPLHVSMLPLSQGAIGEEEAVQLAIKEKNDKVQNRFTVSLKVVGKSLLVHSMSDGEVNLFSKEGQFIFKFNTTTAFTFPTDAVDYCKAN